MAPNVVEFTRLVGKFYRKFTIMTSFGDNQVSELYSYSGRAFFFLIKSAITPYSGTRKSEIDPFRGQILSEVTYYKSI